MKRYISKLRRNAKALSPVFAVLILIAIAVIAGIIVYMFTSGYLGTMMGGGTAGQEKVAIEAVESTVGTVDAWSKSTGGGPVNITEAILKDSSGLVVNVDTAVTNGLLPAGGALTEVQCTFTGMTSATLYTVTLVSKEGNQFVSPTFKTP
jgi:flagellin-like protein